MNVDRRCSGNWPKLNEFAVLDTFDVPYNRPRQSVGVDATWCVWESIIPGVNEHSTHVKERSNTVTVCIRQRRSLTA